MRLFNRQLYTAIDLVLLFVFFAKVSEIVADTCNEDN